MVHGRSHSRRGQKCQAVLGSKYIPSLSWSIQPLDVAVVGYARSTGNYSLSLAFMHTTKLYAVADWGTALPANIMWYYEICSSTRTSIKYANNQSVSHCKLCSNLPHFLLLVFTLGCSWRHTRQQCSVLNSIFDPSFPHIHVTSMVLAFTAPLTKNLTMEWEKVYFNYLWEGRMSFRWGTTFKIHSLITPLTAVLRVHTWQVNIEEQMCWLYVPGLRRNPSQTRLCWRHCNVIIWN